MKHTSSYIFLATGIFYPDIGGPAIHANKIAEGLLKNGLEPVVLTYSHSYKNDNFPFKVVRILNLPKILRWILYSIKCLQITRKAKIVYIFDLTAAGIPAFLSAKIFRKKIIIRIGGDPIWERVVEKGRRHISLIKYYENKHHLSDKPVLYRFIKFMLEHVDSIVTYNNFLKNFYQTYYGISPEKISVVHNPVFHRKCNSINKDNKKFIFAGRFVSYKNIDVLIRAFVKARKIMGTGELELIGHGPEEEELKKLVSNLGAEQFILFSETLPQDDLFKRICKSSVCVTAGLTEYNPNFILECLSFGKPVILSRENGLSIKLKEEFLFDSGNEEELAYKIAGFSEEGYYRNAVSYVSSIPMEQSWDKVIDFHTSLVKKLLS